MSADETKQQVFMISNVLNTIRVSLITTVTCNDSNIAVIAFVKDKGQILDSFVLSLLVNGSIGDCQYLFRS